eukprot:m.148806 g.148806  ORF g.148806 m.148806 type:complete len:59 (-) comp23222_c0_seq1:2283-2459(-)
MACAAGAIRDGELAATAHRKKARAARRVEEEKVGVVQSISTFVEIRTFCVDSIGPCMG